MAAAHEKTVEHIGRVVEITKNSIRISIVSAAACGTCSAKSACSLSESTEKEVVVDANELNLNIGDQVKVRLQRSQAMRAVMLGYVFPLFVLLGVLITMVAVLGDEIYGALSALVAVGLYYLLLTIFKKRLEAKFVFKVERLD